MIRENKTSLQEDTAVTVARGTSHIFLLSIAVNLISAGTFAVIARVVTTGEMGVISILIFYNGLCRLLSSLGMAGAVTKFVAEHRAKGDLERAAAVFYQAIKITFAISILIAFATFLMARQMSLTFLGEETGTKLFELFSVDIVAGALLSILNGSLVGLQKTRDLSLINVGYYSARGMLTSLLVFMLEPLKGIVLAWIVSDSMATGLLFIYNWRQLRIPKRSFGYGELTRFSFPLYVQDIVNFANGWFDRAILFAYSSLSAAGIYFTATTAFGVVATFPGAIATALLPAYSGLYGSRGREAMQDAMRSASRYVCLTATPLAFGMLATARPALTLFVGESYAEGSLPLMILSLFFGLTLVSTSLGGVPLAIGDTMLSLKLAVTNIVSGATLALLFLPGLQTPGVAMAKGTAMVITLLMTIVLIRKKIAVVIDCEALSKSLLASIPMVAIVQLSQILLYSRFLLPVYVLAGGITYLTALRCLHAVRSSDVELVRKFLGHRFESAIAHMERFVTSTNTQ